MCWEHYPETWTFNCRDHLMYIFSAFQSYWEHWLSFLGSKTEKSLWWLNLMMTLNELAAGRVKIEETQGYCFSTLSFPELSVTRSDQLVGSVRTPLKLRRKWWHQKKIAVHFLSDMLLLWKKYSYQNLKMSNYIEDR